jgi:hypothetical protein
LPQRDLWQPPPSSVAPIPDLPALTPERGSSTVSGHSARRYKIESRVTPGLFRMPVRKRARQAVTAFGDDEVGGPEHRAFDLALDQKRDYRILSSNTGKRRWCSANPPFTDRGGGLRLRPLGGRPRTVQQPRLVHPLQAGVQPLYYDVSSVTSRTPARRTSARSSERTSPNSTALT